MSEVVWRIVKNAAEFKKLFANEHNVSSNFFSAELNFEKKILG